MTSQREINRIKIQAFASQKVPISQVAKIVGVNYKTAKKWYFENEHHHHYNTKVESKLTNHKTVDNKRNEG